MGQGGAHSEKYYIKIWFVLLVLLVISIIGPEFGVKVVTLVTAFGIAVVKAWIVAARFMHLDQEKRYIHYMLYTMLIFVALFYFGIAADILNKEGANWVNEAAYKNIELHKDYHDRMEHH